MKAFSIQERCESKQNFGGTKVSKAEEVRSNFVNPKIVVEVFSYIICDLDFQNISCTNFLLHMKIMNGVVSSYLLALYHLFYFIHVFSFILFFFFLFSLLFFNITGLVEPTESGSVYEKS